MSHHLDTPLARQNGQLYLDDLYVFEDDGSTVLIMDVNSNITGTYAEPGFHPEARYEFKVHFDGADYEGLTYRVSFGAAGRQRAAGPPAARPGRRRRAGRRGRRRPRAGGPHGRGGQRRRTRIWAGRIADAFYIDLSLLGHRQRGGGQGHRAGPVVLAPGQRAEQLRRHVGRLDRAGRLPPASAAAARCPRGRVVRHQAGHRRGRLAAGQPGRAPDDVADLLAGRHRLLQPGQHPAPGAGLRRRRPPRRGPGRGHRGGRRDLRRPARLRAGRGPALFPDMLPYAVGTAATFGFAAHNGRTMADNAPEAMLSLVTGRAVPSGLGPSVTERQRRPDFPYVVPV